MKQNNQFHALLNLDTFSAISLSDKHTQAIHCKISAKLVVRAIWLVDGKMDSDVRLNGVWEVNANRDLKILIRVTLLPPINILRKQIHLVLKCILYKFFQTMHHWQPLSRTRSFAFKDAHSSLHSATCRSGGGVVVKLLARGQCFDYRSRRYDFRDWLSPAASKSRYGWNTAKAAYILKTINQQPSFSYFQFDLS